MNELIYKSGLEISKIIKSKELSPVEVMNHFLRQYEKENSKINAIINILEEEALENAKEAEKQLVNTKNKEELGVFFGVPVLIKDNIYTKNINTTFGSKLFKDFVPVKDALLVERLKNSGAILLGKTNLPEFGLVAVTNNPLFGPTKNPWNEDRTPGGSSGGSAAAVSAGISPLSTGNDVGGSIRIPASFCGVFGIKPTLGRVPCYPKLPGWEGMFHEGPITRHVIDSAAMLDVISGYDKRDRFSFMQEEPGFTNNTLEEIKNLKIAYCSNLGYTLLEPEIKDITKNAAWKFENMGCSVSEIELDLPDMLKHLQYITISDILSSLEPYLEEWKEVMDPNYEGFMHLEEAISNRDISKAHMAKDELWEKLWPVFTDYDLLITPTTSVPAFPLEENVGPRIINETKTSRMSWMGFTYPFNFTGQPAASINCGFTDSGFPVGLQIIGEHFDEKTVLKASYALENYQP